MVTCLTNGRRYIGSSSNITARWREHRFDLKRNQHHNPQWQNSYNKYGASDFEWAILEELPTDSEALHIREKHWMDLLHPEFNVSLEAFPTRVGAKATPERNERFSNSMKKMWANLTDEERAAWNKSAKDAWANLTPEEKAERVRKTQAGRGPLTEESRAKMRASRLKYVAEHPTDKMPDGQRASKKRYPRKPIVHTAEWEAGRAEREAARVEKIRQKNLGRKMSEEQKQKLRDAANAQWADPEYRAKHQAATLAAMQDPDVLQRLSESHIGLEQTAEHRENQSKAQQIRRERDGYVPRRRRLTDDT